MMVVAQQAREEIAEVLLGAPGTVLAAHFTHLGSLFPP
jgi:hypothetical protein